MRRERLIRIAAPLAGLLLGFLILLPVIDRNLAPVTSGLIIGVAGVICLCGIAFGIWDARRIEAKRKAKEQIWLKH